MISLTEAAAERASKYISNRASTLGLRIGVKTTGCSGMAYVLEFVDAIEEEFDEVFEDHGVKLVVNKKDLAYLSGLQLDYQKKGLNEGFEFINPNVKAECGCGESFTV
jgi:iron-sulfur cluster assembly protein